jgi:lysophospholipase L1-like esterase
LSGRGRRLASGLILVSWLLAACGGGGEDEAQTGKHASAVPARVMPGTWVVLGSSTAAGIGAPAGQSWTARMAQAMAERGVLVRNLARNGAFTSQALPMSAAASGRQLPPDPELSIDQALALSPRLLLLSFPSNDTAAGFTADETVANLASLQKAAAAAGVATVILGTQPRNSLGAVQRATQAEIDRRLAGLAGDCFVPLQAALGDGTGRLSPLLAVADGTHLNAAGHAAVWERLQALLEGGLCVRLDPD